MLKNIFITVIIAVSCIAFSSCEQDKWTTEPTVLVDVYSLSGFTEKNIPGFSGSELPEELLVYRTKSSLVSMYPAGYAQIKYIKNYKDESTAERYDFYFSIDGKTDEGEYRCYGSRITGIVSLDVTKDDETTTYKDLAVVETQAETTGNITQISEIQDKSFRVVRTAVFLDTDEPNKILLHANYNFNSTMTSDGFEGLSVKVNGIDVEISSIGINVSNNSVLEINMSEAVTSDDKVIVSYNGKGNIKSQEWRPLTSFSNLDVFVIGD